MEQEFKDKLSQDKTLQAQVLDVLKGTEVGEADTVRNIQSIKSVTCRSVTEKSVARIHARGNGQFGKRVNQ